MLKYNQFKRKLNESKSGLGVAGLMDYLSNDYYVHFTDNKSHIGSKPDPDYATTPYADYAWQINSYKKDLISEFKAVAAGNRVSFEKGDSFMELRDIFPYATARKYMVILKAKSGLKWLRVRRMSPREQQALVDMTLQKIGYGKKLKGNLTPQILMQSFETVVKKTKEGFLKDDTLDELIAKAKLREAEAYHFRSALRRRWSAYAEQKKRHGAGKGLMSVASYLFLEAAMYDGTVSIKDANAMLRKLGYDAIRDDGEAHGTGVIFADEPAQVGFLHKNAYTVVDIIERHDAGFGSWGITPDGVAAIKRRFK